MLSPRTSLRFYHRISQVTGYLPLELERQAIAQRTGGISFEMLEVGRLRRTCLVRSHRFAAVFTAKAEITPRDGDAQGIGKAAQRVGHVDSD